MNRNLNRVTKNDHHKDGSLKLSEKVASKTKISGRYN